MKISSFVKAILFIYCSLLYSKPIAKTANDFGKSTIAHETGILFSVVGDFGRNGNKNQKKVAAIMGKKGIGDFIITSGDNFQVNGVRSVNDPLWLTSFENVYTNPVLLCDWYPCLGNHDYKGDVDAEIAYSKISRRWNMAGRYYTFQKRIDDSTVIDFYIIDTTPFNREYYKSSDYHVAGQDTAQQIHWLDSCLTNSKAQWKVVIGHHPVIASNGRNNDTTEMQKRFETFLESKKVDVYFCGHEHQFEHLKSKDGSVAYFVTGTGSDVRPVTKKDASSSVFAKAVPGYTRVFVSCHSMKVAMIDTSGNPIYTAELEKRHGVQMQEVGTKAY